MKNRNKDGRFIPDFKKYFQIILGAILPENEKVAHNGATFSSYNDAV
ncbi:hypothetical protein [Paracnuella aquatica]|nr:hypothetical protein [Paracnuella aquatica]